MKELSYAKLLKSNGIKSYLITEFLGAFVDNVFRWLLIAIALNLYDGGARTEAYYSSIIGLIFILPFMLFSGYGGYFADKYSKRTVIIATKVLELAVTFLAFILLPYNSVFLLLPVLFLLTTQSTFFGPAKYGIIPEMVDDRQISRLNGLVEMSTFLAIITGSLIGGWLYYWFSDNLRYAGLVLMMFSVIGIYFSTKIDETGVKNTNKKFYKNPYHEIIEGVKFFKAHRYVYLSVIGVVWFWFLASTLTALLPIYAKNILELDIVKNAGLNTFLSIGVAIGSLISGRISHDRIEAGIVPFGMFILSLGAYIMSVSSVYLISVIGLTITGIGGGIYIIPLNAYIQKKAPTKTKGQVLASLNMIGFIGTIAAFLIFYVLGEVLKLGTDTILFMFCIITFVSAIYIIGKISFMFVRFILWSLANILYSIKAIDKDNVPEDGKVLFIANHVSYADGLLIGGALGRPLSFMVYHKFYNSKWLNWLMKMFKAIPVYDGKRSLECLDLAREELKSGGEVCIFAEGEISRTGHILPFKRGFEKIVEGLDDDVKIVPVYLDKVWDSVFRPTDGQGSAGRRKIFNCPTTVIFGKPMSIKSSRQEVHDAVTKLSYDAINERREDTDILPRKFMEVAQKNWWRPYMADSTGVDLNFGKALVGSILLSKQVSNLCADEDRVGIMIPASAGGALLNMGVSITGKVPVNLNFTAGDEAIQSAVDQCGIKTIITSRKVLEKVNIDIDIERFVFIEDMSKLISQTDRVLTLLQTILIPYPILWKLYGDSSIEPNSTATIIFSSGTTGIPKGVELTHHNIISNVEEVMQVFPLDDDDGFMGSLPFFHSFGYTATLWLPVFAQCRVAYHPNPVDAKVISRLIAKYKLTFVMTTPTFAQMYIRLADKDQWKSIKYVVTGAEKLRDQVYNKFKEKFGLEILEGYGCSELGPVVSISRPDVITKSLKQVGNVRHSVGRVMPGILTRIVNPDTFEDHKDKNEPGLLLVKSPAQMKGYLGRKMDYLIDDGWYNTGDIARIDEQGFLFLTDRLSRFSKIAGEMVPHLKVENEINEILGGAQSLVVSLPDESRGERLAALFVSDSMDAKALHEALSKTSLPKLWVPKVSSLHKVGELPVLGSGKPDLSGAKKMVNKLEGIN